MYNLLDPPVIRDRVSAPPHPIPVSLSLKKEKPGAVAVGVACLNSAPLVALEAKLPLENLYLEVPLIDISITPEADLKNPVSLSSLNE